MKKYILILSMLVTTSLFASEAQSNFKINKEELKHGKINKETIRHFKNEKINFNTNSSGFNNDLQNVSQKEFGRKLTDKEMAQVKQLLGQMNGKTFEEVSNALNK